MAHVVLPRQRQYARGIAADIANQTPERFADRAVALLAASMCRAGASRETLRAAIVGGAHIFGGAPAAGADGGGAQSPSSLEIGERNVRMVKEKLADGSRTLKCSPRSVTSRQPGDGRI